MVVVLERLSDAVKKAIVENGGEEVDIKFLEKDPILIDKIAAIAAKKCAKLGHEERNSYEAKAENDLKGSLTNFSHVNKELKNSNLQFKKQNESSSSIKIILINCRPSQKKGVLDEISKKGYFPAPSPNLLKLMITNPELVTENSPIVSFDEENTFGPTGDSFLNFFKMKNEICIGTTNPGMRFGGNWKIAVCKQEEENVIDQNETTEVAPIKKEKGKGFFQNLFRIGA